MNEEGSDKYGIRGVVRGGAKPSFRRRLGRRTVARAELELDRRMHTRVVEIKNPLGAVPNRKCYAVRNHEQIPWRFFARFLLDLHRSHAGSHGVRLIQEVAAWYEDVRAGRAGHDDYPRAA